MRYGTYNGCRDYNAVQQFEKFDLTQYEFLPPQPTAFKGKIASVIQTEGIMGYSGMLRWLILNAIRSVVFIFRQTQQAC
jgi:hypothetical protein